MEFDCTKEGKNIYFACREKAAKYNDLLNSTQQQKSSRYGNSRYKRH